MSLVAQMLHYQREDTVQRIFPLVSKKQSGLKQDFPSFQRDHELYRVLVDYINDFRPRLAKDDSGDYLLLVSGFKLSP